MFHVHIDAISIEPCFEEYLLGFGFRRDNFVGHPEEQPAYEPNHHFTRKVAHGSDFREAFARVKAFVESRKAMDGYIEGEYVVSDVDIASRPFDARVAPPFRLLRKPLPAGTFREGEIHITFDRDRSNPYVIRTLREMGLFAGYIPKPYGVGVVFNAQGSRLYISSIRAEMIDFLIRAGGTEACSLKEERIVDWWMSRPNIEMAPQIDRVDWAPGSRGKLPLAEGQSRIDLSHHDYTES